MSSTCFAFYLSTKVDYFHGSDEKHKITSTHHSKVILKNKHILFMIMFRIRLWFLKKLGYGKTVYKTAILKKRAWERARDREKNILLWSKTTFESNYITSHITDMYDIFLNNTWNWKTYLVETADLEDHIEPKDLGHEVLEQV